MGFVELLDDYDFTNVGVMSRDVARLSDRLLVLRNDMENLCGDFKLAHRPPFELMPVIRKTKGERSSRQLSWRLADGTFISLVGADGVPNDVLKSGLPVPMLSSVAEFSERMYLLNQRYAFSEKVRDRLRLTIRQLEQKDNLGKFVQERVGV